MAPLAWSDWFEAAGVAMPASPPVLVSNRYTLFLEAARAGEGVVLGWRHLIACRVAEGRLEIAFEGPLRIDRGDYLKVKKAALDRPFVREFVDFVLAETAATASADPSRG